MGGNPLEAFGERWNRRARRGVAFAADAPELDPGTVSTGIPAVDEITGGGIPRGRTSMFIGEPASGKTLLAQLVIAQAQRDGGRCIYLDVERTFSAAWFRATGVDTSPDRLLVLRPTSLEQGFDMISDALAEVGPDVLVLDSLAAMVPQAVMDASLTEKDFQGLFPRKVSMGLSKVTQENRDTAFVVVNQLRTSLGVAYGNPETIPGGRKLRHDCSLILRVRRGRWLTSNARGDEGEASFAEVGETRGERVGFGLRIRVEKSKMTVPFQETEVRFYFTGAVDPVGATVTLAIERGVIVSPSVGYYVTPDGEKVHGREALERRVREDDALHRAILARLRGESDGR